jgi:hypothetical protein
MPGAAPFYPIVKPQSKQSNKSLFATVLTGVASRHCMQHGMATISFKIQ